MYSFFEIRVHARASSHFDQGAVTLAIHLTHLRYTYAGLSIGPLAGRGKVNAIGSMIQ
jgi:hypothetical protein